MRFAPIHYFGTVAHMDQEYPARYSRQTELEHFDRDAYRIAKRYHCISEFGNLAARRVR